MTVILAKAAPRAEHAASSILFWIDMALAGLAIGLLAALGIGALRARRTHSSSFPDPNASPGGLASAGARDLDPSEIRGSVSTAGVAGLATVPGTSPDVGVDAVLAAMIWYLLGAIGASQLIVWLGHSPESAESMTWVSLLSQGIGAAACAMLLASRTRGGFTGAFAHRPTVPGGRATSLAIALTIVGIGACPLLAEITLYGLTALFPDREFAPHPTITAIDAGTSSPLVIAGMWASAVLAAPLAEELFFRGLVQNALLRVGWSARASIVGAAASFGLVHMNQPHAVPALLALGILFGVAYRRSGRLMVPFLMHAAFNLKTMLWVTLGAGAGG
jgi:membrane protease YdiL (CAAX protease family)